METMSLAVPTRPRWFAGLRRSRPRMLGGVAAGFAEFWLIDPLLLRVLLVSPTAAGVLSLMLLPWSETVLGPWLAVGITQLLWVLSGLVVVGYVVAWILVPQADRDSVARRFLALGGASGTLLKFVLAIGALVLVAWFGLVLLALGISVLQGLSGAIVGLLFLLGVVGLVALGLWVGRGGDLREAVARFGSPGFGRGPEGDPTTVLGPAVLRPDGDPTTVLGPDGDPTTVLGPDGDPTTVLGPDGDPTTVLGPGPGPTVADSTFDSASWPASAPPQDAVDRARAAATAVADARAAAAEAERRQRQAENRARRAAARAVRKERNRWGKLVAAVALVVAGVLFLTDRAGRTSLGLPGIGVVCLALLTAGVLVGAWFGSARWLIAPALLLAGAIGLGAVAHTALDRAADAAPIAVAPKTLPADGTEGMHWDVGAVTVDLTGTRTLDARALGLTVDRGSLTVVVPAGQWTEVRSTVTLGPDPGNPDGLRLLRSGEQSLNGPVDVSLPRGSQPLFLDLHVGIGQIAVIQREA